MKKLFTSLLATALTTSTLLAGSFKTVVIDAGHGGHDRGGSKGKVYEKWLALDTAMRLDRKLKAKGFRTIMTRTSDRFISLPGRAAKGNSYSNSIFISIHYNFTWKSHVSGLETFYYSGRSKPLAQYVHEGMHKNVKATNRGVKYARYYVIRNARNPAILVEGGFVSNSRERERMKDGWYREAIAKGIADGVDKYRSARRRGKVQ